MQVRVPSINGSYSGEQSVQRTGTRTSEDAVLASTAPVTNKPGVLILVFQS